VTALRWTERYGPPLTFLFTVTKRLCTLSLKSCLQTTTHDLSHTSYIHHKQDEQTLIRLSRKWNMKHVEMLMFQVSSFVSLKKDKVGTQKGKLTLIWPWFKLSGIRFLKLTDSQQHSNLYNMCLLIPTPFEVWTTYCVRSV